MSTGVRQGQGHEPGDGPGDKRPLDGPVALLRRAADAGDAEVQFLLARMYANGVLVAQDLNQAVALLRRAAAAGHTRAQVHLARLLHAAPDADSAAADTAGEVRRWLLAAALAGDVEAQGSIAVALARGDGGPPDPAGAYLWAAVAAMRGDAASAGLFTALDRQLTAAQRTAGLRRLVAPAEAAQAAPATPPEGAAAALARVAALAAEGPAAAPDEAAAQRESARLDRLRRAAAAGEVDAQMEIAEILSAADRDRAQRREALTWLIRADLAGHPKAKARRDALCARLDGPAIVAAVRAATGGSGALAMVGS